MYRFPSDPSQKNRWLKACGYNRYLSHWKLCSLHFEECCYKSTKVRKMLKPGAVPTKFKNNSNTVHVSDSVK